jgi:peptidoglycan/LPS O-acetylase OafA/YrhL
MRALGVLLVLTYHFFPSLLPGGFVGVDIFFVVSGYLITALLVREFEGSGRLNLLDFYRRRWRRLFPAIAAMLLVSIPLLLLIPSDFRTGLARQTAAALSWTTNYYEILTGQSYEAQLLPHPFIHTWTLSVEMHYYLVWGAVTALVLYIAQRRRRAAGKPLPESGQTRRTDARVALFPVAAAFAIISALLMGKAAGTGDPSGVYMSSLSHIFPLMIGSAFGCIGGFSPYRIGGRAFKPLSLLCVCVGLAAIIYIAFTFSFNDPRVYSYGILIVSLITALILYLARIWQDMSTKREWRVTDYIGLRSYSIYLFHWPLMIVMGQLAARFGAAQGTAALWGAVFGIPLTFICAELSYRFVERPFRVRRRSAYEDRLRKVSGDIFHGRGARAGAGVIAAALCALSFYAAFTAPRISSIEADLRYGAMSLDVSYLQERIDSEVNADE